VYLRCSSEEELCLTLVSEEELSVLLSSDEELSVLFFSDVACSELLSTEDELSMLSWLLAFPSAIVAGELTALSLLQLAQNRAVETRKRFLKCL